MHGHKQYAPAEYGSWSMKNLVKFERTQVPAPHHMEMLLGNGTKEEPTIRGKRPLLLLSERGCAWGTQRQYLRTAAAGEWRC